jgi:hypothetical protein
MITFDEGIIDQHNKFLFAAESAPKKYVSELAGLINGISGTLIVTENADKVITSENTKDQPRKCINELKGIPKDNKNNYKSSYKTVQKTFKRSSINNKNHKIYTTNMSF